MIWEIEITDSFHEDGRITKVPAGTGSNLGRSGGLWFPFIIIIILLYRRFLLHECSRERLNESGRSMHQKMQNFMLRGVGSVKNSKTQFLTVLRADYCIFFSISKITRELLVGFERERCHSIGNLILRRP